MKITLQYPIKLADGKNLTEINLRRPKVRDLKIAQNQTSNEVDQELALLASLTEEKLVKEDMEELDLSDYAQIQEWFRSVQTGKAGAVAGGGDAGAVV